MDHSGCPFCAVQAERIVFSTDLVVAIWDSYPVNPGHILILTRDHKTDWGELSHEEKAEVWAAVDKAKAIISDQYSPDGFNVGFNQGQAAGQTVFHFHLHVIPRYKDDVDDPRGGVRHVIPSKGNYLGSASDHDLQKLVTGDEDHLLPHLVKHLDLADTCDIAVAFLLESGARLLLEHLRDFLSRGGKARILVGDYLDVTEPNALRQLKDLTGNLELRLFESVQKGFHLKSYTFLSGKNGIAFVGSSNMSAPALTHSVEWNFKIVSTQDRRGFNEIRSGFERLFQHPSSILADDSWIDRYEQQRKTPNWMAAGVEVEIPAPPPEPHAIQKQALQALYDTRVEGFTAGLVVLATGLGKTWLSAFDSNRPEFNRILFVAHREEILDQAIETFRRVQPRSKIGRVAGAQKEMDARLVFASVQTLGKQNHLSRFHPKAFDYIVIDEFHHAAAKTYRRIIDHFTPKFLLGLTATPERMDGGDLLGLCQENLVFQAGINPGIEAGRLCPFNYFGVPDDIDYTNIPWRNAQFDLTELTNAVATEARARNALEQLRQRGGSRCIAFCCSQRHADFMAEFFNREGVKAVAVHSGAGSAPRATSLENLQRGDLEVVFAVDMFNEGVDVPNIDTVLMLRPTESTVIWLQQLGRGLRISKDKPYLTVIDYIGNHRAFLMKLRSLAALTGQKNIEGGGRLREFLEAVLTDKISLPAGCAVTYDLETVDILGQLLKPTRVETALEGFYRDFEYRHGVRPTASEAYHSGLNPRSNSDKSWIAFVERMGGLTPGEVRAWAVARDFFLEMEKMSVTRSYKIVLLLAMLNSDSSTSEISIDELTQRVSTMANRIHGLAQDFSVRLDDKISLRRLLIENPINAFMAAKDPSEVPYFRFDGQNFSFAFSLPDPAAFTELLREILDWRLAQYLSRGGSIGQQIVCRVARAGERPILFLPQRGTQELPERPVALSVNGEDMEGIIAKIAINVVHYPGDTTNQLPDILHKWFGNEAGLPGRGERVVLRRNIENFVMEPLVNSGGNSDANVLWARYLREAIPPLFGLTFDQATWNAGLVVKPSHIFLLVTLSKDDMNPDHQYADHFISDKEFSWQSQNQNTQSSARGQKLRNHRELGIDIHLFVRPTKKTGSKPTPFVYCGKVDFVSWEGDAPITVHWMLREPVPQSLWEVLKVPA